MQIEAGQFIGSLRNRLAAKLTSEEERAVLGLFDRACVEVLTGSATTVPAAKAASKPKMSPKKRAAASERMKQAWAERKRKQAEAEGESGEAA